MSGLLGLVESAKHALHHHKEGEVCSHEKTAGEFEGGVGDGDSAMVGEISGGFGAGMGSNDVQETGSAERGGQAQSRQNSHQPSHQPSRQSSHQHHESQRESDEKEENNANFGMQC